MERVNVYKTKYYVWRRDDGYVSSTAGRMPMGWKTPDGREVTFEQLGVFDEWNQETIDLIERERAKTCKTLN